MESVFLPFIISCHRDQTLKPASFYTVSIVPTGHSTTEIANRPSSLFVQIRREDINGKKGGKKGGRLLPVQFFTAAPGAGACLSLRLSSQFLLVLLSAGTHLRTSFPFACVPCTYLFIYARRPGEWVIIPGSHHVASRWDKDKEKTRERRSFLLPTFPPLSVCGLSHAILDADEEEKEKGVRKKSEENMTIIISAEQKEGGKEGERYVDLWERFYFPLSLRTTVSLLVPGAAAAASAWKAASFTFFLLFLLHGAGEMSLPIKQRREEKKTTCRRRKGREGLTFLLLRSSLSSPRPFKASPSIHFSHPGPKHPLKNRTDPAKRGAACRVGLDGFP